MRYTYLIFILGIAAILLPAIQAFLLTKKPGTGKLPKWRTRTATTCGCVIVATGIAISYANYQTQIEATKGEEETGKKLDNLGNKIEEVKVTYKKGMEDFERKANFRYNSLVSSIDAAKRENTKEAQNEKLNLMQPDLDNLGYTLGTNLLAFKDEFKQARTKEEAARNKRAAELSNEAYSTLYTVTELIKRPIMAFRKNSNHVKNIPEVNVPNNFLAQGIDTALVEFTDGTTWCLFVRATPPIGPVSDAKIELICRMVNKAQHTMFSIQRIENAAKFHIGYEGAANREDGWRLNIVEKGLVDAEMKNIIAKLIAYEFITYNW